MSDVFDAFLRNVSARGAYCVDCLSNMFGEPVRVVGGYLRDASILGEEAECANCEKRTETFRHSPSG